ncbi:MAG: hypothetical protein NWT04_08795 [Verrucomicrobiales bacterium]|jgi:hypothetical protein|nr:hypothetical protein [Verrucomicrobiales bacterium]MDP4792153.1 hypothetical protein [Verrucomicrobiales bacterium]MDP5007360.1 hypothetical protein [Verrucomicrobiales bacterium]
MRIFLTGTFLTVTVLLLTQCETIDTSAPGSVSSMVVTETLFYPDERGVTYRVPAGVQVIGAGGVDCIYIIENGGSVMAHSGDGNSYRVKAGGHFRGFTHPATNCTVTYEAGAVIEQEEVGPGTTFVSS